MATITKICKYCGAEFQADPREHNRGNAIYCSVSCSSHMPKPVKHRMICKHCGTEFMATDITRAKYCSLACKQRNYRLKSRDNGVTMKTIYTRLNRNACEICSWDITICDLHHIIPVSEGGTNDVSNVIVVCPNHHRIIHKNLVSQDDLFKVIKTRTISSSANAEQDA